MDGEDGKFMRYTAAALRNAHRAKSDDEWARTWLGLLRERSQADKKNVKARANSERLR
jgi:hypothetical protein